MNKASTKLEAAYQRAREIYQESFQQGRFGRELHGDAKRFAERVDDMNSESGQTVNVIRRAYGIGLKRHLRSRGWTPEQIKDRLSTVDANRSHVGHG